MHRPGIFYGWWIVLATSLIHFWGAGIFVYSFTAFFNPLVSEFGWSYSTVSFAASFRSLESGIASPVVGFLVDRVGARRLIFSGAIVAGAGAIWLSQVDSLLTFYLAFITFSIGSSFTHPLPGWSAINNWFSRKRGFAMGILMGAVGASGALIPLVNWLIVSYGWRTTFIIAGVATWIISIPLSMLVRQQPERYGYLPDGDRPDKAKADGSTGVTARQGANFTVLQAVRTRAFWLLAMVATLSSAALHAVTVHVMPGLISVGMSRDTASTIAAALVVSSVAGRFGIGWLGDRLKKKYLLVFSLLLQAAGMALFINATTVPQAIGFLALFGPGFGGVITLRVAMQGDYFGRKAFGAIQGIMMAIFLTGNIASPAFTGWVYDTYASYQLAWIVFTLLVAVSIPLALTLKPPAPPVAAR